LEKEISLKNEKEKPIKNDNKKTSNEEEDELWDNGMIIPDWLKTD